jgi:hypothetical protein
MDGDARDVTPEALNIPPWVPDAVSKAARALNPSKRAGEVLAGAPSQEELEVGNYILNVMDQLDRQRTNAGEQGIWSNFSDAGKHAIAGSAVANVAFIRAGRSKKRPMLCIVPCAISTFSWAS